MATKYTIVSKPSYVFFMCPHCGEDIEVPFRKVVYNSPLWDDGAIVVCPECGKEVELDEWEYD